jgi:hypothetical protein
MTAEWHHQKEHHYDPKIRSMVTKDIPNCFIMYAGAFSAILSRNDVEQFRWYWNVKMTFGGMTECSEAVGTTSASEEDAKAEALHVFKQWVYSLTVYAPHALDILRSK